MTQPDPFNQQPHIVVAWGGEDTTEARYFYGPFPDRASAERVVVLGGAYAEDIALTVEQLKPPRPEDIPAPQTGPLSTQQLQAGAYEVAKQLVLREVDIVALVASLNPDEMGMGDYSYSPQMRDVIRQVRSLLPTVDE